MLRWGLAPGWAKDPRIGHRLVNARSETAWERSSFRTAFAFRRCLVPTGGFYEWRREGTAKQSRPISMKNRGPLAFAVP